MNHPLVQVVLLIVAAWMLLVLVSKHLGLWVVVVLTVTATAFAVTLYWLRYQRPRMAIAYTRPWCRPWIHIVCKMAGEQPPVEQLCEGGLSTEIMLREPDDFVWAIQKLQSEVFGYDLEIQDLIASLNARLSLRAANGESTHAQPLATFLLVGPTGVGKRCLAEKLARVLFRSKQYSVFDLARFASPNEATVELLGSLQSEGSLLRSVRRFPHQVVILENVQRMSSSLQDSLYAILKQGECSDARSGATIRFDQTVLILTSSAPLTLMDEARDPRLSVEEHSQSVRAAIAEAGILEPLMLGKVDQCFTFPELHEMDKARVIAHLMQQECQRYQLRLEFVAPEVLARLVREYRVAHGFELLDSVVRQELRLPILLAKQNQQPALTITNEPNPFSNPQAMVQYA